MHPVVSDLPLCQEQGDAAFDLVGPQHPVGVERVAGVVEEVRVGRRRDGGPVVGLERCPDVLGVVVEVEDEGAVLADAVALVGAVQP
jgi:hypothetical protein